MRSLAALLSLCLLASNAFSQDSAKPKAPAKSATKAKPSPVTKRQTTSASSEQKKTAAKTPVDKPVDEAAAWDKIAAITEAKARVDELKSFLKAFPASAHRAEGTDLLVSSLVELGNERLGNEDAEGAGKFFREAVERSPQPISSKLFSDVLSRVPTNLFFRGGRQAAFDIAKALEDKAGQNPDELLSLARFYLTIENGAEARRLADAVLKIDSKNATAYDTIGLGYRMNFQLDESASAYAKALELDPASASAKRGLAEMKRASGKAEEAVSLYKEILATDESNAGARTGLILSMFDAGQKDDAEAEMAKVLEGNPGNVLLLAGAAYWYAAHNDGAKAVDYANRAISADPRYVWSHIALARGLMLQNKPVDAEKILLAARRYGNFPTIDYEIASARMAAGFYRDAADELAKSFSVNDGVIHANLGGRVPRDSKYFTELVGFERRASIAAPTAADDPDTAGRLLALLELRQATAVPESKAELVKPLVERFVAGDDGMKLHRELFAATLLLEHHLAPDTAQELAKSAVAHAETGLAVASPVTAVMANELYHAGSGSRSGVLTVPDVPKNTLLAIIRGRIEDTLGWAAMEQNDNDQALIHLKRAVAVSPGDSQWWRTSAWRLATALARAGKNDEALDFYVRSYRGGAPDAEKFGVIEALYKQVVGSTEGLEDKIGRRPGATTDAVTASAAPQLVTDTPSSTPAGVAEKPAQQRAVEPPRKEVVPWVVPVKSPDPTPAATPASDAKPVENQASERSPIPLEKVEEKTPASTEPERNVTSTSPATPEPTPSSSPVLIEDVKGDVKPKPTPVVEDEKKVLTKVPKGASTQSEDANPKPKTPEEKPVSVEAKPIEKNGEPATRNTKAAPEPTPVEDTKDINSKSKETLSEKPTTDLEVTTDPADKKKENTNSTFAPVVISIPAPSVQAKKTLESKQQEMEAVPSEPDVDKAPEKKAAKPNAIESAVENPSRPRVVTTDPYADLPKTACRLTISDPAITLKNNGGDLAVMVGADSQEDAENLKASSSSPADIAVKREPISGVRGKALFVVSSVSSRTGVYQVRFDLPCGGRTMAVRVR